MPDPFRKQYRQLTDAEKAHIERVKDLASQLHAELVTPVPPPNGQPMLGAREFALAKTNLEQTVMWATKAITG